MRELTPREPVWRQGEFVDQPIYTEGPVPHWSRWEKSTTTFGPVGRLAITAIAVLWVCSAAAQSPITLVFVLPLVAVIIRGVWQRGWASRRTSSPSSTWVPLSRLHACRGIARRYGGASPSPWSG